MFQYIFLIRWVCGAVAINPIDLIVIQVDKKLITYLSLNDEFKILRRLITDYATCRIFPITNLRSFDRPILQTVQVYSINLPSKMAISKISDNGLRFQGCINESSSAVLKKKSFVFVRMYAVF